MNPTLRFVFATVSILLAPSAAAEPSAANEVITGTTGEIVVGEFAGGDGFGHYLIDILKSSTSISGFAVSSDAPNAAAFRDGWEGTHLSMIEWNAGTPLGIGASLKTTDIGTFENLFGNSESGANLYFSLNDVLTDASDHDQVTPGVWTDEPEFVFFGDLASEFVAFGANGAIIDKSLARATPDERCYHPNGFQGVRIGV